VEVFWPLYEVESELESHVSWQSDEVIKVIRCENTSHMGVGAQIDGSYLIATLDKVSAWQNVGFLEQLDNVEHNYCPAIVLELERHLSHEPI